MKTPSMNTQAKKPATPGVPKVLQLANPRLARVAAPPVPAPLVVQRKSAPGKHGPKITTPPVHRTAAQKVVQPMLASRPPKLPGSLISTARTVQRAEENPYKKEYKSYAPKKSSKRASARMSPYGGKGAQSPRLQSLSGGAVRPGYSPARDSQGNDIWDGSRNSLSWSGPVTTAMALTQGGGCQIQGPLCTGAANGIDHINDFADLQSGITQYVICDGNHHWKACYKDDAVAMYNNDDDTRNMQWACTQCNSKKNGSKGRYENQPVWLGQCPGGCGYAPWGEEAE